MLHAPAAVRPQAVEAQAVSGWVDLAQQAGAKRGPLRGVHLALEDRLLHALAEI